MDLSDFLKKLPGVSDELIEKAMRVDQLFEQAGELEAEIWAAVNAQWSDQEIRKARGAA